MSPTSDITDVRKCPIGQYPLISAVIWPPCWIIIIIIRILLIIVRRHRRRCRRHRRRAVAPTSNTASHDYHEKIS